MIVTKYYCDVCGNECSPDCTVEMFLNGSFLGPVHSYRKNLCNDCYSNKIMDIVTPYLVFFGEEANEADFIYPEIPNEELVTSEEEEPVISDEEKSADESTEETESTSEENNL